MSYRNIDGLMEHLRDSGISIDESTQRRQLMNNGYYHGYKGYRFFKSSSRKLPFTSYSEINATILYDTKLKALFYPKIMFIETALKNNALETLLEYVDSENIQDMLDKAIYSYSNAPVSYTDQQKKKLQKSKLGLQNTLHQRLADAYMHDNPTISHFYNVSIFKGIPIWALFEILMLGDFGRLLSCLTYEARDMMSKKLGLNLSADTNRVLIYKYVYVFKELRNAIAHNSVVFDTRFQKIEITKPMRKCIEFEIGLPFINFKSIGDYIILTCYILSLLKVSKTEILSFIEEFETYTNEYALSVNSKVSSIVIRSDLSIRMAILKKYIKAI